MSEDHCISENPTAEATKIVAVTGPALEHYCHVKELYFSVPASLDLSKQEEGLVDASLYASLDDLSKPEQVDARERATRLVEIFKTAAYIGMPELSLYRQLRCVGHVGPVGRA